VEDVSGYVGGYLYLGGYYYPMSGSCSISGTTGSISLTNWDFGTTYTGTITVSGSSASISGTLTDSGGTSYSWSGILTGLFSASTITQTCEGTYTATINGNSGTIYLFADSGGNVIGDLNLVGYNYVLAGTCVVNGTSGSVTLSNMTTGSSYSGTVAVGSSISMSGSFALSSGSGYSWSATSQ
jgi:hypothetical protein